MDKRITKLTQTQSIRFEQIEENKNETVVNKKKTNFVKLVVGFLKSLWLGVSD